MTEKKTLQTEQVEEKITDLTNQVEREKVDLTPEVEAYIRALEENLKALRPSSVRDRQRIDICLRHIREIRSQVRRLKKYIEVLENGEE